MFSGETRLSNVLCIIIHISSNILQCDGQNNWTIYFKTLHETNVLWSGAIDNGKISNKII